MAYRDNENGTITDRLDRIGERISNWEERISSMKMTGEQKQNVSIARAIVGGVLLLAGMVMAGSVSCNRANNATRVELAKECPAFTKAMVHESRPSE